MTELVCYTVKDLRDEKEIVKTMKPVITSKQASKVDFFYVLKVKKEIHQ